MTGASGAVPHTALLAGLIPGGSAWAEAVGKRGGLPGICSSPGKRWPGLPRAVAVEDHEEN